MLRLKARAKINWSLDIVGVLPNGYHRMEMLMSSVELADTLTISLADTLALSLSNAPDLPMERNLVLKAARALQQATGCTIGATMTLLKQTPVGAGMGGGSADAAAALVGLNELWHLRLSMAELQAIGLTIGADVPFMLAGGLARVGGIGESITALPQTLPVALVAIQPCQALSTPEGFAAYDHLAKVTHPDTDRAESALLALDWATLSQAAGNVLAQASEQKRPQIPEAIAALQACEADFAMMTGSGSAVYGAFASDDAAQAAHRLLRKRWHKCWLTQTSPVGVTFE